MTLNKLHNISQHYQHDYGTRAFVLFVLSFFFLTSGLFYSFTNLYDIFDETHYAIGFALLMGSSLILMPSLLTALQRRELAKLHDEHVAFHLEQILTPDTLLKIRQELSGYDLGALQLHYADKFYSYCEQQNYIQALWAIRKIFPILEK